VRRRPLSPPLPPNPRHHTQQNASTTEQDAAVTETVATVEEIRATITQASERAQAVAKSAMDSVNVSRNGQEAVDDSVQGMETIRQRVESIAQNILTLSERTQQIGEVHHHRYRNRQPVQTPGPQSSIEAARAGEEGKGFAVVAMEVRQLAEQSREATARVATSSTNQQATNTAVMVTEEGSKGADAGVALVERAGQVIQELTAIIEDSAQAANQIAASTPANQRHEPIGDCHDFIKQATTQTAASTRQAERSVQDLNEMAGGCSKLSHVIRSLKWNKKATQSCSESVMTYYANSSKRSRRKLLSIADPEHDAAISRGPSRRAAPTGIDREAFRAAHSLKGPRAPSASTPSRNLRTGWRTS